MQTIEEVKNSIKDAPISAIVENYIPLRRAGTSVTGICPFHQDTKPSMSVSDEKGIFKCFACGAAGDHISFITQYLKVDFKEAILEATKILGIPYDPNAGQKQRNPKFEMAKRLYNSSSEIYYQLGQSQRYPTFQDFVEKRRLEQRTIEKFKIGYSSHDNCILSFLQRKAQQDKLAISTGTEVGLLKASDNRGHYDTFRDRIMFPIWDQYGQIVAYTGRATKEVQKAKYMNSKDSFFFHKRQILFGLNFAKRVIRERDQVIIVEGHMDMIALDQFGFENTVAIMGTALDPKMTSTLEKITHNVILSLDNDQAGEMATEKVASEFLKKGIVPKVLDLGDFKDPDELLVNKGSSEYQNRIDSAQNYLDWRIDRILGNPSEDLDERLALLPKVFQLLTPLGNSLTATERIHRVLNRLEIKTDPDMVINEYKNSLKGMEKPNIQKFRPRSQPPRPVEIQSPSTPPAKLSKAEQQFIKNLIIHPECFESDSLTGILDFVKDIRIRKAHQVLNDIFFEVEETDFLSTLKTILQGPTFTEEIKQVIASAIFQADSAIRLDEKAREGLLSDLKKVLQRHQLREQEIDLKTKIEQIQDPLEQNTIIKELMSIRREISKLNT